MDISVLIPTLKKRRDVTATLLVEIKRQLSLLSDISWEIVVDCDDAEISIGEKRNRMVAAATGYYCVFIDDDDAIHPLYFETLVPMIKSRDYDVAQLTGGYYQRGAYMKPIFHSVSCQWQDTPRCYLRPIQHLNLMKTSIARNFTYPSVTFGEDFSFGKQFLASMQNGAVYKEFVVPKTLFLYHYLDKMKEVRHLYDIAFTNGLVDLKLKVGKTDVDVIIPVSTNGPVVWDSHIKTTNVKNMDEYVISPEQKKDDDAMEFFERGEYQSALNLWDELLDEEPRCHEGHRFRIERNRRFAIENLNDSFAEYPWELVQSLTKLKNVRNIDSVGGVTLFILTCKRFDLFTRTMNSFIRCCEDRSWITRWICIDDNSHPNDRAIMKALYPFMEFVFKTPNQIGHPQSMNIARSMITTPYVITLEDDWQFVTKMNYIERALSIFDREPDNLKQIFFNRHYVEIPDDAYLSVTGGILKQTVSGYRYMLHEYLPFGTKEHTAYTKKHPINFAHQPHFALRPSFFKRELWDMVGPFNESPTHSEFEYFENEYGRRYVAEGLVSAYFDGVYCIHTGRLNRDRENPLAPPNAYQLNNMSQYGQMWPNEMVGRSAKEKTERVALTVTTCKRLDTFLPSMCTVLSMCKDPSLIDRFLIVDDNSSESDQGSMLEAFPFFEMVKKNAKQKGHAKSMNIILDECKNFDFIFQNEDDFFLKSQYSISDALYVLKKGPFDQVTLLQHPNCTVSERIIEEIKIWPHTHNLSDTHCPSFFRVLRDKYLGSDSNQKTEKEGCWWPNFSLNPSIVKRSSFGEERYTEDLDPTYFEYEMALRLWKKNDYKTCTFGIKGDHATEVSAYVLNEDQRLFDNVGCGNHRAQGGDRNCMACKMHREKGKK